MRVIVMVKTRGVLDLHIIKNRVSLKNLDKVVGKLRGAIDLFERGPKKESPDSHQGSPQ